MKHCALVLVLFFSIGNLYSQSTVSGYYITKTNDTITVDVVIKKGVFGQIKNDLTKEVKVIDDKNESVQFTPSDIKSYGFTFDGISYEFYSKPTKKGENKFLTPVIIGPKTSLYQYSFYTSGSGSNLPSNQVFYTFEKADGSYLLLGIVGQKKLKTELKEFYKESQEAQKLIDERLKDWLNQKQDLIDILSVVNKS
ncbi:hypothetical protein [Psychroserpens algicola]|uniref:DUF4468 domain-containing protein n=1 Tax=Psychroserpens algicola TaxID=1719034 RepID=A0ABT0HBE9_9FLAO|nr:hypothetical protein [Psychroserpens algicola]MCK8481701.1 hypothetical protein [Psychroserpens algicola]